MTDLGRLLFFLLASAPETTGTLRVRCLEDCSVLVDGQGGLRENPRLWLFEGQPSGQRRIEVKGVLGRALFSGFVEVPPNKDVTVQADGSKRLLVLEVRARRPVTPRATRPSALAATTKGESLLHVRCPRACTVVVDGLRRRGSPESVTVGELGPGEHAVEVTSVFNEPLARGTVRVPGRSEVFVAAANRELRVITVRPLRKP